MPNSIPPRARVATRLEDFESHTTGTGFKHNALDIVVSAVPGITSVTLKAALTELVNKIATTGSYVTIGADYNPYDVNGNVDPIQGFNLVINDILTNTANVHYDRLKNGGVILLQEGEYFFNDTLNVPPGILIVGEGWGTKVINVTKEFNNGVSKPLFRFKADPNRTEDSLIESGTPALGPFLNSKECGLANIIVSDNFLKLSQASTYANAKNINLPLILIEKGASFTARGVRFMGRSTPSGTTGAVFQTDINSSPFSTFIDFDHCFADGFCQFGKSTLANNTLDHISITHCKIRAFGKFNSNTTLPSDNSFFDFTNCNISIANNYLYGDNDYIKTALYISDVSDLSVNSSRINFIGNSGNINKTTAFTINDFKKVLLNSTLTATQIQRVIINESGNNFAGGEADTFPVDDDSGLGGGGGTTFVAGGDLTGSDTSQNVAKIQGVIISGSPLTGQVLVASDATHAAWADQESPYPRAIGPRSVTAHGLGGVTVQGYKQGKLGTSSGVLQCTTFGAPNKMIYDPTVAQGLGPSILTLQDVGGSIIKQDIPTGYITMIPLDEVSYYPSVTDACIDNAGFTWAVEGTEGKVVRIQHNPTQITHSIVIDGTPERICHDPVNDLIYVMETHLGVEYIVVIDPVTVQIVGSPHPIITSPLGSAQHQCFGFAGGFIWCGQTYVDSNINTQIVKINPNTFSATAYNLNSGSENCNVVGFIYNSTNNIIYTTLDNAGGSDTIRKIISINVSTGAVINTYNTGIGPKGVMCYTGTKVWVHDLFQQLTELSPTLVATGNIVSGYTPARESLIYDALNDQLVFIERLTAVIGRVASAGTGSIATLPFASQAVWTSNLSGLSIDTLQNVHVSAVAPTIGQVLTYNGTNWIPSSAGGFNRYQFMEQNALSTAGTGTTSSINMWGTGLTGQVYSMVSGSVGGMGGAAGIEFVSRKDDGILHRIDVSFGRIVTTINLAALRGPNSIYCNPTDVVTLNNGDCWVLESSFGNFAKIDGQTNAITKVVSGQSGVAMTADIANQILYVRTVDNFIKTYNLSTGDFISALAIPSIPGGGFIENAGFFRFDASGHIWATYRYLAASINYGALIRFTIGSTLTVDKYGDTVNAYYRFFGNDFSTVFYTSRLISNTGFSDLIKVGYDGTITSTASTGREILSLAVGGSKVWVGFDTQAVRYDSTTGTADGVVNNPIKNAISMDYNQNQGDFFAVCGVNLDQLAQFSVNSTNAVLMPFGSRSAWVNAPSGSFTAGGDLTGTSSTQTVSKIQNVTITGTPVAGNVLTASSGIAASWAAPTGGSGGTSVTWAGDAAGSTDTTQKIIGLNAGASGSFTAGSGDFLSLGSNSAASGVIRMSNNTYIKSRNAANTADLTMMFVDAANQVQFGDANSVTTVFNGGGGTFFRSGGFNIGDTSGGNIAFSINGLTLGGATVISTAAGQSAFTIKQDNNTIASATGGAMTVQAQNATGTTSTGGLLALKSGTGTTAAGSVQIFAGATQVVQLDGTLNGSFIAFGSGTGVGGVPTTGALRFPSTASTGSTSVAGAINAVRPGGSECTMMRYTTGDVLEIGDAGRNGSIGIKSAGNIVADASGGFHMGTNQIVFRDIGGGTVSTYFNSSGSGANSIVWQNTITSMDLKFQDKTAATSTGIPLQILGNNTTAATGTNVGGLLTITAGSATGTGTGGDFTFGPGSGTTNGKLVLANSTIGTIVGAAGGADALPATPLGYLTVFLGTTQVKIPYYTP